MWHWVDLAIVAIIGVSMLTGVVRGFIKELIALCIWILAFWLAFQYSPHMDPWLQQFIHDKTARMVTAFILILLGTLIIGGIINSLLGLLLRRSGLSGTDRILGMGFGFLRGVLLVALIMVVVKMTSLPYEHYSKESVLYAKFNPLVNWLYDSMPNYINQLKILQKKEPKASQPKPKNTSLLELTDDYELSDA